MHRVPFRCIWVALSLYLTDFRRWLGEFPTCIVHVLRVLPVCNCTAWLCQQRPGGLKSELTHFFALAAIYLPKSDIKFLCDPCRAKELHCFVNSSSTSYQNSRHVHNTKMATIRNLTYGRIMRRLPAPVFRLNHRSNGNLRFDHVKANNEGQTRRTKIICTLGPACWSVDGLVNLIDNGMNIARFNFSHGDHAGHFATLERLRSAIAQRPGARVGIMLGKLRCLLWWLTAPLTLIAFLLGTTRYQGTGDPHG